MSIYIDSRCDRFLAGVNTGRAEILPSSLVHLVSAAFQIHPTICDIKRQNMALMPVIRKIEDEHRVCRYKPKTSLLLWHTKGELLKNILAILCNIMIVNHKRCREKKKNYMASEYLLSTAVIDNCIEKIDHITLFKMSLLCSTEDSQSYRF